MLFKKGLDVFQNKECPKNNVRLELNRTQF